MELGALVCVARAPRCDAARSPTACAWRLAGSPAYAGPTVRPQRFAGTDRQVRGLLLDVLRAGAAPVRQAGPGSRPGRTTSSASEPSTGWSSTGWSIRCPTAGSPYRAS